VQRAAAALAGLRAVKDRLPVAELIRQALARTGYDAVLLSEFLGPRKLANLRKLIDDARSFDQAGMFTLDDFITQLSQFIVRQPDEPLAATHPESVDVVRLMSIHQAKGLEFPVVVIADLDRPRRGPLGKVAFTRQLGPMIKDSNTDAASGYDLFWLSESDQEQAELVRLLYVATTRAADCLILSSGLRAPGAARGPWTELLFRHFDPLSGLSRVSPLPKGEERHAAPLVNVTASQPPLRSKPVGGTARHDLARMVADARKLAAAGRGRTPKYLAAVPPDRQGRRQYSFSRLSGGLHAIQASPRTAGDGDEAPGPPQLDPLGLGTLVHAVLANVDFTRPDDAPALVQRYALRHLPEGAGLDEATELVRRLLASPRGTAIAAAAEVHRELEFLLAWPPGGTDRDGLCLQGFIDCLYRDAAGGWRLIDYKTNRVTAAQAARVAESNYQMQMLVYGLAVERILGRPPEELTLCFLRPGVEHRFAWDDSARQRAVTMVSEAIRSQQGSPITPLHG
jgi:ATP-dependent helicase/nuclease subunit A